MNFFRRLQASYSAGTNLLAADNNYLIQQAPDAAQSSSGSGSRGSGSSSSGGGSNDESYYGASSSPGESGHDCRSDGRGSIGPNVSSTTTASWTARGGTSSSTSYDSSGRGGCEVVLKAGNDNVDGASGQTASGGGRRGAATNYYYERHHDAVIFSGSVGHHQMPAGTKTQVAIHDSRSSDAATSSASGVNIDMGGKNLMNAEARSAAAAAAAVPGATAAAMSTAASSPVSAASDAAGTVASSGQMTWGGHHLTRGPQPGGAAADHHHQQQIKGGWEGLTSWHGVGQQQYQQNQQTGSPAATSPPPAGAAAGGGAGPSLKNGSKDGAGGRATKRQRFCTIHLPRGRTQLVEVGTTLEQLWSAAPDLVGGGRKFFLTAKTASGCKVLFRNLDHIEEGVTYRAHAILIDKSGHSKKPLPLDSAPPPGCAIIKFGQRHEIVGSGSKLKHLWEDYPEFCGQGEKFFLAARHGSTVEILHRDLDVIKEDLIYSARPFLEKTEGATTDERSWAEKEIQGSHDPSSQSTDPLSNPVIFLLPDDNTITARRGARLKDVRQELGAALCSENEKVYLLARTPTGPQVLFRDDDIVDQDKYIVYIKKHSAADPQSPSLFELSPLPSSPILSRPASAHASPPLPRHPPNSASSKLPSWSSHGPSKPPTGSVLQGAFGSITKLFGQAK